MVDIQDHQDQALLILLTLVPWAGWLLATTAAVVVLTGVLATGARR